MKSFAELSTLPAPLLRAIEELGYKTPSPIQEKTLPVLLDEPTDFIGLAATGTGKTAAFALPLLKQIDPQFRGVQGLILCPTRELALQVCGQINLLGKHMNVRALAIYGGAGYDEQIRGLKQGAKIVVGTPGRVIDHMRRGTLKLNAVKTLILDEADEMISMGFKEDLETVLEAIDREASHIWLFSATMGNDVRKVADAYLRSPLRVQVNQSEMLSSTVEQIFYPARESHKPEILCKIIEAADDFYGLVFCQTKSMVSELTQYLTNRGYKVDCLHGDKDQKARERTMQAFRDRKILILICTDVASRGLDVKDVTHVINYSIPRELDVYVHRIGRTARSGKSGMAISLVTPNNRNLLSKIERLTKTQIHEGKIPSRRDIGVKKITKLLPKFQEQKNFSRAIELLGEDWKSAIAGMTPEEIVGRFLALTAPEIFVDRERPATLESQTDLRKEDAPRRKQHGSSSHSHRGDRPQRRDQRRGKFPSRNKSRRFSSSGPKEHRA